MFRKPETIAARCGAGNGRAKAVYCPELDMRFGCARDACKHLGLSKSAVGSAMKRGYKVLSKYTFIYANY